jgi:DNA-binding transcriptional MerR regulator
MALAAVSNKKVTAPKNAGKVAAPTEIPDKLMFRIGEVSRIVGVETYVLRYWETEFPQLAPKKSGSGHRMYRRKEVEQLLLIRQLLYERQYTIKGARNYLKELARRKGPQLEAVPSGESAHAFDAQMQAEPDGEAPVLQNAEDTVSVPNGIHQPSLPNATPSLPNATPSLLGLRRELREILAMLS